MIASLPVSAVFNLNHPGYYIHWGFILISLANLVVIALMIAVFVAALFIPFVRIRDIPAAHPARALARSEGAGAEGDVAGGGDDAALRTWTGGVRRLGLRYLPPGKLLPDAQPAYVASWVYVFGVLTVGALVVVVASGLVLAIFGPAWWHTSWVGHFVNSLHLWSVELFMGFMVAHLWAKFWMAAWRGRRSFTWMTGVVCFLVAVGEAFTGYISQTNFDSQWIGFEAKDGLNSGGIGAYFNAMNFGQGLMLHIALLPLALIALVALHVLLVRVHGVVPPIDARPEDLVGTNGSPSTNGTPLPVPDAPPTLVEEPVPVAAGATRSGSLADTPLAHTAEPNPLAAGPTPESLKGWGN